MILNDSEAYGLPQRACLRSEHCGRHEDHHLDRAPEVGPLVKRDRQESLCSFHGNPHVQLGFCA